MPRSSTEETLLRHFRREKKEKSVAAGAGELSLLAPPLGHQVANGYYNSFVPSQTPTSLLLPPTLITDTTPVRDVTIRNPVIDSSPAPQHERGFRSFESHIESDREAKELLQEDEPPPPPAAAPSLFESIHPVTTPTNRADWERSLGGVVGSGTPQQRSTLTRVMKEVWTGSSDWELMMETYGSHKLDAKMLIRLTQSRLMEAGVVQQKDLDALDNAYAKVLQREYAQRLTKLSGPAQTIETIGYNYRCVYDGVRTTAIRTLLDLGMKSSKLSVEDLPEADDPRSWWPSDRLGDIPQVHTELLTMIGEFSQLLTEQMMKNQEVTPGDDGFTRISQRHKDQLQTLFQEARRVGSQAVMVAAIDDPSLRMDAKSALQQGAVNTLRVSGWLYEGQEVPKEVARSGEDLLDVTLDVMKHGLGADTLPGWRLASGKMVDVLKVLYPLGPGTRAVTGMSLNEVNTWCRGVFQQMQTEGGYWSKQSEQEKWSCARIVEKLDALPQTRHDYLQDKFKALLHNNPRAEDYSQWLLEHSDKLSISPAKNVTQFSQEIAALPPPPVAPVPIPWFGVAAAEPALPTLSEQELERRYQDREVKKTEARDEIERIVQQRRADNALNGNRMAIGSAERNEIANRVFLEKGFLRHEDGTVDAIDTTAEPAPPPATPSSTRLHNYKTEEWTSEMKNKAKAENEVVERVKARRDAGNPITSEKEYHTVAKKIYLDNGFLRRDDGVLYVITRHEDGRISIPARNADGTLYPVFLQADGELPDSTIPTEEQLDFDRDEFHKALYESLQFFWQQLYEWLVAVAAAAAPELEQTQPWGLNLIHTCQLALVLISGSGVFAWLMRLGGALLPSSLRAKAVQRMKLVEAEVEGEAEPEGEEPPPTSRVDPYIATLLLCAALI